MLSLITGQRARFSGQSALAVRFCRTVCTPLYAKGLVLHTANLKMRELYAKAPVLHTGGSKTEGLYAKMAVLHTPGMKLKINC